MKKVMVSAFAKINLSLDVLRRKEDGYHELEMIMQQIDLKDVVTIEETLKDTYITCNNPKIPIDSSNLVYKAYKIMANKFNIYENVHIHIEKNIPMAAGLAGGSSDAAATLKGLNKLWDLNLTHEELMKIGLKIGADVPYCIKGKTMLAKGIGEELTELKDFKDKLILIAKPDIDVSTAYVYKNLDVNNIKNHPKTKDLIKAIENDNIDYLCDNMINVLETVTIKEYPIIDKVKGDMIEFGAIGSMMSGSGPTVFGIFTDKEKMINCSDELKKYIKEVYITKTI